MSLGKHLGKLALVWMPFILLAPETWGQTWDIQYLMDLYPDNSTYTPYDMTVGIGGSGSTITDGVLKFVDGGAAGSRGYYLQTPYVSTGITILTRARLLTPPNSIRGRMVSFFSQSGGFGGNLRLTATAAEIIGDSVVNSYAINTYEWHVYRIVHDVSLGLISVYVDEDVSTRIDGAEQTSGMPGQLLLNGGYSLGSLNDVVETNLEFEMDYLYVAFDTAHPDDTYTVNSEGGGELVDISTAVTAAETKGVTSTVSVLGGGPYVEDITIGNFDGLGTAAIMLQNDAGVPVTIQAANNIDRTPGLLGFPDYLGLLIGSPSCSLSGFTIVQASESNNVGGYNAAATIIGTAGSATIVDCTFTGAAYMGGTPTAGNSALVTIDPGEYSAPAEIPYADFSTCSFQDSDKGFSSVGASHATFQNCDFTANTATGIEIFAGAGVTASTMSVDECRIYNNGNQAIDFWGASATITSCTIENNAAGWGALYFYNLNDPGSIVDVNQCVIRNDSVYVASPGTITIRNSEMSESGVSIAGVLAGNPSVTLTNTQIYDGWMDFGGCDVTITGSSIIGGYDVVRVASSGTFVAANCKFSNYNMDPPFLDDVVVVDTQAGVASISVQMTNCILEGGRIGFGIAFGEVPVTADLNYCTLVNFGKHAAYLDSATHNLTITNSILGNAQQESILNLGGSAPTVRSCHFFGNGSDPIPGVNPTFGDPVLDPDFNMTVYTDAIDTGIDGTIDNTVTDDYDETGVRPRGLARDRGAQENDLTPVILNPIGNRVVNEGQTLQFTVSASGTGPLVYDAFNVPPGANFNPGTRVFRWDTDYTDAGVYPGVHFVVHGPTGSDAETITIVVNPVPQPGTGSVAGRVTRADTGSPLAGATVNLSTVGDRITNSLGNYLFPDVLAGPGYTLTVTMEGFDPISVPGINVPLGGLRTVNVPLDPSMTNTPPPPPISLAATGGDNFINLRWDPSPAGDLAGYNVYLVSPFPAKLNTNLVTGLFFQHRGGLVPFETYQYVVRAVDLGALESIDSNTATAPLVDAPPEKVSDLRAIPLGLGRFDLSWEISPSIDAAEYRIYYDNGTGIVDYGTPLVAVEHPTSATTVGPFPIGQLLHFGIRVFDGYQEETNTNVVIGVRAEPSVSGLVRTVVSSPYPGKLVGGDIATVVALPVAGVADQVGGVTFEYRRVGDTQWETMASSNAALPNPDREPPFYVPWDISLLPEDDYDLRAVAVSLGGTVDLAPPSIRMTITNLHPESFEAESDAGIPYLLETIEVGRTKRLHLRGEEGKTLATVTVYPGAVTSDTLMALLDWIPDEIRTLQNSDIMSADLVTQISVISGDEVFGGSVTIRVPWEDEDDDGLLDGTTIQEEDLLLYRIDVPNQNYKLTLTPGVVEYLPRVGVIVHRDDVLQSVLTSGDTIDDLFFVPSNIETDTNTLEAQLSTVGMYITLAESGNTAYMTARAPAFAFTGFRVGDDERVRFSDGSGSVQYTSTTTDISGPNGIGELATSGFLAPGISKYSLVGMIGTLGDPFLVGTYTSVRACDSSAKIYLGFNDDDFSDNVNLTVMTCDINISSGTSTAVSAPDWQEYR